MDVMDEEKLSELEAEARSLEAVLITSARSWALDQSTFTREFLLQEARLVVINQAHITEQIADEVPGLKAEIEEVCRAVSVMFERWGESIDLAKAKVLAQDPRKVFLELTQQAHTAFGEAFARRGYDAGSGSREWASGTSNWNFYIPETGTARNPAMKFDQRGAQDLSDLWSSWASISRQINTAKDQIQRRRAAYLWDAD